MSPIFALLVVLTFAALSEASTDAQRKQMLIMLEEIYKPCILRDVNCPPGGGLDYKTLTQSIKEISRNKAPAQCKCDLSSEACTRRCYYEFMIQTYQNSVANGKTDPAEIAQAKSLVRQQMDAYYKPCIMEGRNCQALNGVTYAEISTQTQQFLKIYSLPDDCDCDLDGEKCARQCAYSYLKQSMLSSIQ